MYHGTHRNDTEKCERLVRGITSEKTQIHSINWTTDSEVTNEWLPPNYVLEKTFNLVISQTIGLHKWNQFSGVGRQTRRLSSIGVEDITVVRLDQRTIVCSAKILVHHVYAVSWMFNNAHKVIDDNFRLGNTSIPTNDAVQVLEIIQHRDGRVSLLCVLINLYKEPVVYVTIVWMDRSMHTRRVASSGSRQWGYANAPAVVKSLVGVNRSPGRWSQPANWIV